MQPLVIAQHVKKAPTWVFDGWIVAKVNLPAYLAFVRTSYDCAAWARASKHKE